MNWSELIFRKVELRNFTKDQEYLELVEKHLKAAFQEFPPDLVVYNAGTDVLEGDPLGQLEITASVRCSVFFKM